MPQTRIAIAIALAGLLIALAIFARPVPGRYVFTTQNDDVRLVDTATGATVSCKAGRNCITVQRSGDRLQVTQN